MTTTSTSFDREDPPILGANPFVGQLVLSPLQVSATSHTPALARHSAVLFASNEGVFRTPLGAADTPELAAETDAAVVRQAVAVGIGRERTRSADATGDDVTDGAGVAVAAERVAVREARPH